MSTAAPLALAVVEAVAAAEKASTDSSRRFRSQAPPKSSCVCIILQFPTKPSDCTC